MSLLPVEISKTEIANFCQRHRIAKLSIFGSVLREDFSPESDIDFLVEFQPQTKVSYLDIAGMEEELAAIVGRTVDLRTPAELSRYFRQDVLDIAMVQYVQS